MGRRYYTPYAIHNIIKRTAGLDVWMKGTATGREYPLGEQVFHCLRTEGRHGAYDLTHIRLAHSGFSPLEYWHNERKEIALRGRIERVQMGNIYVPVLRVKRIEVVHE